MVHPHVLEMSGIDPNEYTGFAFGVGLERIALLKYEIDDMRLLYENDIRFLNQFQRYRDSCTFNAVLAQSIECI